MPHGRRWTKQEDDLITEAAVGNRTLGITQTALGDIAAARAAEDRQPVTDEIGYIRRLQSVADRTGRTYAAVRQRASRLRRRSYRPRERDPETRKTMARGRRESA